MELQGYSPPRAVLFHAVTPGQQTPRRAALRRISTVDKLDRRGVLLTAPSTRRVEIVFESKVWDKVPERSTFTFGDTRISSVRSGRFID